MNFYFAIDAQMIEKYGLPERLNELKTFNWKLSQDTFMFCTISNSGGRCWDSIKKYQKQYDSIRPFAICEAHLSNEEHIPDILACAIHGDKLRDIEVIITEITWFNHD